MPCFRAALLPRPRAAVRCARTARRRDTVRCAGTALSPFGERLLDFVPPSGFGEGARLRAPVPLLAACRPDRPFFPRAVVVLLFLLPRFEKAGLSDTPTPCAARLWSAAST